MKLILLLLLLDKNEQIFRRKTINICHFMLQHSECSRMHHLLNCSDNPMEQIKFVPNYKLISCHKNEQFLN